MRVSTLAIQVARAPLIHRLGDRKRRNSSSSLSHGESPARVPSAKNILCALPNHVLWLAVHQSPRLHSALNRYMAEAGTHRESRRRKCSLDIHAVVHQVGNELSMRQRLIGTSHDAEANVLITLLHKCRNDRVVRAFVSGEYVRVCGAQDK